MLQPKNDPFFEQLKKDVQAGIDDLDAGRSVSAEEVRRYFRERSKQLRKELAKARGKRD
jgi:hypothetical protein